MEPIIIKLQYPFEHGGETIEEVRIPRRPTGRDMLEADKSQGSAGRTFRVASSVTGLPLGAFSKMDAADIVEIQEVLDDFLTSGRATGETA